MNVVWAFQFENRDVILRVREFWLTSLDGFSLKKAILCKGATNFVGMKFLFNIVEGGESICAQQARINGNKAVSLPVIHIPLKIDM